MRVDRPCFWCCEPFTVDLASNNVDRTHKLFCDIPCTNAHKRGERFIELVFKWRATCQGCGVSFVPKSKPGSRRKNEYCSRRCAFDHHDYYKPDPETPFKQKVARAIIGQLQWGYCHVCFSKVRGRVVCLDGCRAVKGSVDAWLYGEDNHDPEPFKCSECGQVHIIEYGSKRRTFCSHRCARRYSKRTHPSNHRRRARRYGVEYEPVNRLRVMDRDGWMCGICGERIDKRTKAPHPRSPSLDHIVPMAQGGGHLYDNVQAAHFLCNSLKGDRVAMSQFVMLGGVM